jgi:hypothetical protein
LYAASGSLIPFNSTYAHGLDLHGVLNRYQYARTRLRLGDRDCGHQRHFERAAVASAWLPFRTFRGGAETG